MPKIILVLILALFLCYVFSDQLFPGGFANFAGHLANDLRAMLTF